MASVALAQLRTKALELSEAERAELAHDLVASLDGLPDSNIAQAWDEELLRRIAQVENGTAQFVDRAKVKQTMQTFPS